MAFLAPAIAPGQDPIGALAARAEPAVMAVIAGIEGPSYRPLGAAMAVFEDGTRAGTLSSGCIEADIALHAADALKTGRTRRLRYGRGSPFADIELPCGGGLDILLLPRPDRTVLRALQRRRASRTPCGLRIDPEAGRLALMETPPETTGWRDGRFEIREDPALRFLIFGKGPEACTFAALVQSAGYPNLLLSPDEETRTTAAALGCATQVLARADWPAGLAVDARTAVVLFFHDHDWEPPILRGALATSAFYIGAQGSRRARDARLAALAAMGVPEAARARLRGPVGLIPSARDPGTLAVSVLAEVLAVAMAGPAQVGPA